MRTHAKEKAPAPVVAGVLSAALAGLGWLVASRYLYQKKKFPENWSKVGTLQEVKAYPIKSCGGIQLLTAECTSMGLRDGWLRDRVLMVVTEKDNFITARQHPEMLLIQPTVNGSVLTLTHPDMEPVSVNLAEVKCKDIIMNFGFQG
ncbi:Mitochondrial amidoxime-reducing component 1 [Eumeta japonica]|uniref:Mitochondrial amidoxime-reducing component 1 n=1 Tax=Eumeta variegata TaxID=151549 RepID=A0A4C1Z027_EUMVA|nr:Mitochondrial amidoxime-reducing component 1 [Eumeta japonica]